ncbi:MAG: tRNA (5-methylaminomethyl-2-thiouridine)(34)-methyltransferase MnmD [Bacteroidetes bacterium]|nr:tRNA (5-methylaminomethyl-2-thiouridine)(34)-methyltransferase MnmD [Bacteroidota bacterium]
MNPDLRIVPTKDGSNTLFSEQFKEHYHSVHGARQESMHVFIQMGLAHILPQYKHLNVLEVGGGTLLNARLSFEFLNSSQKTCSYHIAEAYAPNLETMEQYWMNSDLNKGWLHFYQRQQPLQLQGFNLQHRYLKIEDAPLPKQFYHLVYFDAFAPNTQPELWQVSIFNRIAEAMVPGGILVSYCAQGQFKRNLKQAGWKVEAIPGPPGKREMTRACKQ